MLHLEDRQRHEQEISWDWIKRKSSHNEKNQRKKTL